MIRNITIILGHPNSKSYCGSLAEAYAQGAEEQGHHVRPYRLGEVDFDSNLHQGYNKKQALKPQLKEVQDAIQWADHLVIIYPIWWGSMPALLKGFFDRVFLPGYAFKYRENSQHWDRLLKGRSAHVIMTMDTPPWYYRIVYKSPGIHQIKKTILEFCGIKPVKITTLGPIRYASPRKREQWLQQIKKQARSF